uniref:Diacylglycerol kinase n=1 Tax=Phasianus colchicus TaxID=9054 RepID=A0A669QEN7_PHACC
MPGLVQNTRFSVLWNIPKLQVKGEAGLRVRYNSITACINRLHDEPAAWLSAQPLSISNLRVTSSYPLDCFRMTAVQLHYGITLRNTPAHRVTGVTNSAAKVSGSLLFRAACSLTARPRFTAASKRLAETRHKFGPTVDFGTAGPTSALWKHQSDILHASPFQRHLLTTCPPCSEQGLRKAAVTHSTANCCSSSVASDFFSFSCCSSAFSCHPQQLFQGVLLKCSACFHPGKQTLKIFDGTDAVKRNQFRLISVPRIAKNEEVVEAALRAYYINDDQQEYELQTFTQQALLSDDIINRNDAAEDSNLGSVFRESVPEAWIIRAKPKDQEVIRIYPAWLEGMTYISLRVNKDSTAQSVIKEVLPLLGRQRMVLDNQELILHRLEDIRKVSVRQMNQTRFYIVENSKSTVQVNIFVGGLPPQLSPEEYMNILKDELAIKTNVVSLSHVYQAQGAVVLEISCFSEAERIYMLVKDTTVNDKPLNAVVIPDVTVRELPTCNCWPLLVFVNPKSGGLKGRDLLYCFRKLLNPHQVFELTNGGPLPGFHTFSKVPSFRVLVCGGDGTVGWVLGALEEIRHKLVCSEPSVAILPLGTGNDLGRVLRWGAGYSGEDPYSILISVDEADDVLMDRWTILLDAEEPAEGAENGMAEHEPPKIVQMNNYCGLGIDAELSLDFHHAREEEPGKFNSRFHNKGVYVKVGLQKISHTRNLHKDIKLQVDQREVELPNIEGLIFINIPSWGSGADLWGTDSDDRFEKPRIDDGLLEVVGVTGVVHMGQVQSGFRSGIRIAQGSYFRVTLLKPIPVQVDGEPWIQAPGQIIISAAGPKVMAVSLSQKTDFVPSVILFYYVAYQLCSGT